MEGIKSGPNDVKLTHEDEGNVHCSIVIDPAPPLPSTYASLDHSFSPRASDELLAEMARQLAAEYTASTDESDFGTSLKMIKNQYKVLNYRGRTSEEEQSSTSSLFNTTCQIGTLTNDQGSDHVDTFTIQNGSYSGNGSGSNWSSPSLSSDKMYTHLLTSGQSLVTTTQQQQQQQKVSVEHATDSVKTLHCGRSMSGHRNRPVRKSSPSSHHYPNNLSLPPSTVTIESTFEQSDPSITYTSRELQLCPMASDLSTLLERAKEITQGKTETTDDCYINVVNENSSDCVHTDPVQYVTAELNNSSSSPSRPLSLIEKFDGQTKHPFYAEYDEEVTAIQRGQNDSSKNGQVNGGEKLGDTDVSMYHLNRQEEDEEELDIEGEKCNLSEDSNISTEKRCKGKSTTGHLDTLNDDDQVSQVLSYTNMTFSFVDGESTTMVVGPSMSQEKLTSVDITKGNNGTIKCHQSSEASSGASSLSTSSPNDSSSLASSSTSPLSSLNVASLPLLPSMAGQLPPLHCNDISNRSNGTNGILTSSPTTDEKNCSSSSPSFSTTNLHHGCHYSNISGAPFLTDDKLNQSPCSSSPKPNYLNLDDIQLSDSVYKLNLKSNSSNVNSDAILFANEIETKNITKIKQKQQTTAHNQDNNLDGQCHIDETEQSNNYQGSNLLINDSFTMLESNISNYLPHSNSGTSRHFSTMRDATALLDVTCTNGEFMKLFTDVNSIESGDDSNCHTLHPKIILKNSKGKQQQQHQKQHQHQSSCSSKESNRYLANLRTVDGVIHVDKCLNRTPVTCIDDESYFNCTYFDCFDDDEEMDDFEEDEGDQLEHSDDGEGNESQLAIHKLRKVSQQRRRRKSCRCESVILEEQAKQRRRHQQEQEQEQIIFENHGRKYAYKHHGSLPNESIVKLPGNNKLSKSHYSSSSNIFSTPVHRSSRRRAMDYRTYESLMALDSLINETRGHRSHSTLGQYSSLGDQQSGANDLIVYNVHHQIPLSTSTSPVPLPLPISSQSMSYGTSFGRSHKFSSINHHQSFGHLFHHSNPYGSHEASFPHIDSDAITLVPVTGGSIGSIDATTATTAVNQGMRFIYSQSRPSDFDTIVINTTGHRRGSLPTAGGVPIPTTTTTSNNNGDANGGHCQLQSSLVPTSNVPSRSTSTSRNINNGYSNSNSLNHRSLPSSPSLEQSRRATSNSSSTGRRLRNETSRRSGGRSLLSSPLMLKRVIKQK